VCRGGPGAGDAVRVGPDGIGVITLFCRPRRREGNTQRSQRAQRRRAAHHQPVDGIHYLADSVQRHSPLLR
jgi:hypothetical protein